MTLPSRGPDQDEEYFGLDHEAFGFEPAPRWYGIAAAIVILGIVAVVGGYLDMNPDALAFLFGAR